MRPKEAKIEAEGQEPGVMFLRRGQYAPLYHLESLGERCLLVVF